MIYSKREKYVIGLIITSLALLLVLLCTILISDIRANNYQQEQLSITDAE